MALHLKENRYLLENSIREIEYGEFLNGRYDDMARTVAIGLQDFEKVRTRNVFYVDKTDFI